ncbi:hypothetical protein RDI58_000311 [Solanum bulbocastanum]|uniref:Uncharacterized protein n=1 Tax=Solanum bulbocastanum TaxID=147425 RepID=A0AAN8YP11_SOLBU
MLGESSHIVFLCCTVHLAKWRCQPLQFYVLSLLLC